MTTVPNNFFPGAKIRKYLNQDVNKSEISIFSLVINDQTTLMYQFKKWELHLSFTLFQLLTSPIIFAFSVLFFVFAVIFFVFQVLFFAFPNKKVKHKTEIIFSCPQEPKAQYNTILTFPIINHFICIITCRFSNLLVIIFVISKVQLIQFKKQAEVTWQIVTAKLKSVKPPYYRNRILYIVLSIKNR